MRKKGETKVQILLDILGYVQIFQNYYKKDGQTFELKHVSFLFFNSTTEQNSVTPIKIKNVHGSWQLIPPPRWKIVLDSNHMLLIVLAKGHCDFYLHGLPSSFSLYFIISISTDFHNFSDFINSCSAAKSIVF